MAERVCGVPSCKKPAVGSCQWAMQKRVVDVDGNPSMVPTAEKCGLLRCLDHVHRTPAGTTVCLWHREVDQRQRDARARDRGVA